MLRQALTTLAFAAKSIVRCRCLYGCLLFVSGCVRDCRALTFRLFLYLRIEGRTISHGLATASVDKGRKDALERNPSHE